MGGKILQVRAIQFVFKDNNSSYVDLLKRGNFLSLSTYIIRNLAIVRDKTLLEKPKFSTKTYGYMSFRYHGSKFWNALHFKINNMYDYGDFKPKLTACNLDKHEIFWFFPSCHMYCRKLILPFILYKTLRISYFSSIYMFFLDLSVLLCVYNLECITFTWLSISFIILFNSIRKLFIFAMSAVSIYCCVWIYFRCTQCNRITLPSMAMLSSLAAPEGIISTPLSRVLSGWRAFRFSEPPKIIVIVARCAQCDHNEISSISL